MNRVTTAAGRALTVLVVVLLAALPAAAQGGNSAWTLRTLQEVSIPVRDAPDLAERLGGLIGAAEITIPPAPAYTPGDRKTFFVGDNDTFVISQVEAELAAEFGLQVPLVVRFSMFEGVMEPNDSAKSSGIRIVDMYLAENYQADRSFGPYYHVLKRKTN